MEQHSFSQLPLGLGMALAQDLAAMNYFATLPPGEQSALVGYIQSATTGEDARQRIDTALDQLHRHVPPTVS